MRVLIITNGDGTDEAAAARGAPAVERALAAWRVTMHAGGGRLRAVLAGTRYHAERADGSLAAVLVVRDHP